MRIIGKAPRLFCIDGIDLVPGSQIITGEAEEKLKKSEYFKTQCDIGNFVVADETEADTPAEIIKPLSAEEKIAVIKETLTDAELDKLEEDESRKGVLKAIKDQRKALREGREEGAGDGDK